MCDFTSLSEAILYLIEKEYMWPWLVGCLIRNKLIFLFLGVLDDIILKLKDVCSYAYLTIDTNGRYTG